VSNMLQEFDTGTEQRPVVIVGLWSHHPRWRPCCRQRWRCSCWRETCSNVLTKGSQKPIHPIHEAGERQDVSYKLEK
jgi:hypothetical protein